MEFSKAFDPLRAIGASWRMLAVAPAPMWIGGFLMMLISSGAGIGSASGYYDTYTGSGNSGEAIDWGPILDHFEGHVIALVVAVVVVIAI